MEPSVTSPGSGSTDAASNQAGPTTPIEAIVNDFAQYREYRDKQRKTQGKNAWGDELEAAFMEAIQMVPETLGRNVKISDYIFERTGERRTREQVSGHIQKLRKLLKDCPEFMKHVERRHLKYPQLPQLLATPHEEPCVAAGEDVEIRRQSSQQPPTPHDYAFDDCLSGAPETLHHTYQSYAFEDCTSGYDHAPSSSYQSYDHAPSSSYQSYASEDCQPPPPPIPLLRCPPQQASTYWAPGTFQPGSYASEVYEPSFSAGENQRDPLPLPFEELPPNYR